MGSRVRTRQCRLMVQRTGLAQCWGGAQAGESHSHFHTVRGSPVPASKLIPISPSLCPSARSPSVPSPGLGPCCPFSPGVKPALPHKPTCPGCRAGHTFLQGAHSKCLQFRRPAFMVTVQFRCCRPRAAVGDTRTKKHAVPQLYLQKEARTGFGPGHEVSPKSLAWSRGSEVRCVDKGPAQAAQSPFHLLHPHPRPTAGT